MMKNSPDGGFPREKAKGMGEGERRDRIGVKGHPRFAARASGGKTGKINEITGSLTLAQVAKGKGSHQEVISGGERNDAG